MACSSILTTPATLSVKTELVSLNVQLLRGFPIQLLHSMRAWAFAALRRCAQGPRWYMLPLPHIYGYRVVYFTSVVKELLKQEPASPLFHLLRLKTGVPLPLFGGADPKCLLPSWFEIMLK